MQTLLLFVAIMTIIFIVDFTFGNAIRAGVKSLNKRKDDKIWDQRVQQEEKHFQKMKYYQSLIHPERTSSRLSKTKRARFDDHLRDKHYENEKPQLIKEWHSNFRPLAIIAQKEKTINKIVVTNKNLTFKESIIFTVIMTLPVFLYDQYITQIVNQYSIAQEYEVPFLIFYVIGILLLFFLLRVKSLYKNKPIKKNNGSLYMVKKIIKLSVIIILGSGAFILTTILAFAR